MYLARMELVPSEAGRGGGVRPFQRLALRGQGIVRLALNSIFVLIAWREYHKSALSSRIFCHHRNVLYLYHPVQ